MNFNLNTEQKAFQKAAEEFAKGEFDPEAALEFEKEGLFPKEILKKAADLGFIGIHFPEQYGGQELGLIEHCLVVEAFCRTHPGMGMALGLSCIGSEMILYFGSDEQKSRYLPPLAKGELLSSFAYLEWDPEGKADVMKTFAGAKGDGYVINGRKSFVINGSMPGPMIVLCRLADSGGSEENLGVFLVEKDGENQEFSMPEGKIGMRMVPVTDVSFNDLELPRESLIGNENQGKRQLEKILELIRIQAAAIATGIARGAFDRALAYSKEREQFGRKIGSFEAIKHRLADMAVRIESAGLLTYKAASEFHKDAGTPQVNYMAKMVSADAALQVAESAVHIFGGYGYIVENNIENFYREAGMVEFIGTTGNKEKFLIADGIMGNI